MSINLSDSTGLLPGIEPQKECIKCQETKPISQFRKLSDRPVSGVCKDCYNYRLRQWDRENTSKSRAIKGKSRAKHRIERNIRERSRRATDPVFRKARKWADKKWRLKNPKLAKEVYEKCASRPSYKEQIRAGHLRRSYGMGIEEYNQMFESQRGLCAICHKSGQLHVDHDHNTGAVRALLCRQCNTGIGHLSDSPERLRAAADYLDRHGSK